MGKHKHDKRHSAPASHKITLTIETRDEHVFYCRLAEKDTVVLRLVQDEDATVQMTVLVEEAEAFFDQALSLVTDKKHRPICGALYLDTSAEHTHGERLEISFDEPDSLGARIKMTADGEKTAQMYVERLGLERFLFSALEGLFPEIDDDD